MKAVPRFVEPKIYFHYGGDVGESEHSIVITVYSRFLKKELPVLQVQTVSDFK